MASFKFLKLLPFLLVTSLGGLAVSSSNPAAAQASAKQRRKAATTTTGGSPGGGMALIFSPTDRLAPPTLLDGSGAYTADAKAIKSPLLFTHIRLRRGGSPADAGQLLLEEKAATIDVKKTAP